MSVIFSVMVMVLLGQPQKRLSQPVVIDQDHGPSHREDVYSHG